MEWIYEDFKKTNQMNFSKVLWCATVSLLAQCHSCSLLKKILSPMSRMLLASFVPKFDYSYSFNLLTTLSLATGICVS